MSDWKILFVDDEPNILSSLRRSMADGPYLTCFANSAAEGLEMLRNEAIHVVVSDHQMPFMNGSEFLHRVHLYDSRIIRCLLSGYTDLATLLNGINRGEVFRFIPKPWEEPVLARVLKDCVTEYQARLGEALLQATVRRMDLPFLVGMPADSTITWMNPAARELLLDPGAGLPDYDDIGTGPDAMPWALKLLVPQAEVGLHDYLTARDHVWRGQAGRFRLVDPKNFPDQAIKAWLWGRA